MSYIVINDRSREVPNLKVMRSRITGKLQTYEHSNMKSPACNRFEQWDMSHVKDAMQKQADLEGIDVIVEDAKHFRTADADFLEINQWIPVEVAANGEVRLIAPLIIAAVLLFLKYVLPLICVAVIVGLVGVLWIGPFTKPPEPYKGFYQYDKEGKTIGPMTYTEFYTLKQAEHPDKSVCHYCGQLFDTAAERDEHEKNCPWRDKPWTQDVYPPPAETPGWVKWAVSGGIGFLVLILGISIVGKR